MALRPGQQLAHYRILEKIGQGGMGVVYRAHDSHLDREVALKVLPGGALGDKAARKRFRKEARALSKLNHPAISTVHDFDTRDGLDFLVMELIDGEMLHARLKRGPLEESEIVRLGCQFAEGLSSAHEHEILHRDLKPGNLRVTSDGRVKILDFGLAKLAAWMDSTGTVQTADGSFKLRGTLPYMPPEQLSGKPFDARGDIYGAGAVLYEMATGRRMFAVNEPSRLINAILQEQPPAPRTIRPDISPRLESIILKALDKSPEKRQQSARELWDELKALRRRDASVPLGADRGPTRRIWLGLALGTVALLSVLLFGQRIFFDGGLSGPGPTLASVAVLPFANVSANPEMEYLSDGLTDSLINRLAELPAIDKVIARQSVFHYKGRDINPREIGRELQVAALVTGRVVERNGNLLISVALIDAANNRHVWGEQFRREPDEILSVQHDIAGRISASLRVELTGDEKIRLTRRYTDDPEAYRHYLKGRYYLNQYTQGALEKARQEFLDAVEIDPGYALAYAGLADVYQLMSNILMPPDEAMPKARAAAQQALSIEKHLGEAHASLGVVSSVYDRDFAAAEASFRQALEFSPGYSAAHLYYGLMLSGMGRSKEANAQLSRARELDPLSPLTSCYAALAFYLSRRYDRAVTSLEEAIAVDPDHYLPHLFLGLVYGQTGEFERAVAELERGSRMKDAPLEALSQLAHGYAVAGRPEEARELLDAVLSKAEDEHVSAYNIALIHIGLGEHDRALEWLEKADAERSDWFIFLHVDPRLDDLRSDPRFRAMLQRVRIPG